MDGRFLELQYHVLILPEIQQGGRRGRISWSSFLLYGDWLGWLGYTFDTIVCALCCACFSACGCWAGEIRGALCLFAVCWVVVMNSESVFFCLRAMDARAIVIDWWFALVGVGIAHLRCAVMAGSFFMIRGMIGWVG